MKKIVLILFFMISISLASAQIIFEDNFDNTPDWQSTTQSGTLLCPSQGICPQGWDAFRDASDDYGQPNHRVDSDYNHGTGPGKAMTAAYEYTTYFDLNGSRYFTSDRSVNEGVEGGGVYKFIAPADGVSGYDDIYIAWWEKFHTWDWVNQNSCFLKMMRILLGVDTSKPSWSSMDTINYYTIVNWKGPQDYPTAMQTEIRNPLCSISGCMDDDVVNHFSALWPGVDGQWHHNEFHIKLNNVGQSDGILEYYQDGIKKWERANWKFRDTDIKVNALIIMDNVVNDFEIGTENEYSIDDFVVSTTYIDPSYVVGNSTPPQDITPPITTASPSSGTYSSSQSVTLSRNEAGTTYYTTDGSTPTISSTVFSSPIIISQNTTLKFFSVDNSGNNESVRTEFYVIDSSAPPAGDCADINILYNFDSSQPVDSSGKGNDGSCSGSSCPTYTSSGRYSGAFSFDGNDYITANNPLSSGSDATISFWINTLVSGGYIADGGYYIYMSGGGIKFYSGSSWTSVTPSVYDGTWHHVAIVQSGSNTKIYVDGFKYIDSTTSLLSASSNIDVGTRGGGYYAGLLDDFAVYTRALSQSEVAAIANSTSPLMCESAPSPFCGDTFCNGAEVCGDTDVAPKCNTDCGSCSSVNCTDYDNDTYSIEGGSCGTLDCNDNDPMIHPNAQEICNNTIDDNCNGQTDEGCQPQPQGIIFEDNFDSYGDWASDSTFGTSTGGKNNPPFNLVADFSRPGWVSYRHSIDANTVNDPAFELSSEATHSGGKSLKYELENTLATWNGGGMTVYLGGPDNSVSGEKELYISFWAKFDDNYIMPQVWANGFSMKLLRIYFGDNADLETNSLSNGIDYNNMNKLATYLDYKGNGYMLLRIYQFPSIAVPQGQGWDQIATADSQYINNYRQWTRIMYHIKLNTYGNGDGLLELYIGDTKVASLNNIELVNPVEGPIENNKINVISIPDNYFRIAHGYSPNIYGNAWNSTYYPALDPGEFGLYIDDLVISTSYVPLDYVPGSGTNPTCDADGDNLMSRNATCGGNDCDDSDPNILQCHPADTSIPYNCVDDTELISFVAAWKAKGTTITMPVLMSAIKIWKGCNP